MFYRDSRLADGFLTMIAKDSVTGRGEPAVGFLEWPMDSSPVSLPDRRTQTREGRCTESFLVRTWREGEGEVPSRFFVRNLKTGEEKNLSGARALAEYLALATEADPEG